MWFSANNNIFMYLRYIPLRFTREQIRFWQRLNLTLLLRLFLKLFLQILQSGSDLSGKAKGQARGTVIQRRWEQLVCGCMEAWKVYRPRTICGDGALVSTISNGTGKGRQVLKTYQITKLTDKWKCINVTLLIVLVAESDLHGFCKK